jgi:hypothetical protein
MGIPDLRFINRKVPVLDVARALDLKIGANGNIHCWRTELHQNGDRTASVGIRRLNNTVKCFGAGCGIGPLGPVDLVMSVLGVKRVIEAAQWIADRFAVPELAPKKRLQHLDRRVFQYGHESDLGLLVHSGLWAGLSPTARAVVPVLLELAERDTATRVLGIQISYVALGRYAGTSSPNAIAAALRELQEMGWLSISPGRSEPGSAPVRATSAYVLTPRSDQLLELANENCAQMRREIELERELRAEARAKRRRSLY